MRLPPGAIRLAASCHLQVSGVGPSSLRWGGWDRWPGGSECPIPRGVQAGLFLLICSVRLGIMVWTARAQIVIPAGTRSS